MGYKKFSDNLPQFIYYSYCIMFMNLTALGNEGWICQR
jgi:hypothetical protein